MPNHLTGLQRTYMKISFRNVNDLVAVRKAIMAAVERNKELMREIGSSADLDDALLQLAYESSRAPRPQGSHGGPSRLFSGKNRDLHGLENILDIREYDVPYHLRVCIDLEIRVGLWYIVWSQNGGTLTTIQKLEVQPVRPDPVVLAFDIETTKLPLKFPDASIDSIIMISYMVDGKGFLIINREIVSQDIEDFEYTPKPEYEGIFRVFNEKNEKELLVRFYEHIQALRPTVFVTYNGDFFDWPFIEARTLHHGLDMKEIIGFYKNSGPQGDDYISTYAIHMDAYKWVKRDSYLPQGSQGLKAVTSIKLGYTPLEVDPEDMLRFASERPQDLANYSVSDALCTYHLYMKYVHPFIFSLCNIIPLGPDEVLRKGSGTLCETLLMAESKKAEIVMPNKHVQASGKLFEGHLLESETYVGGHVESLESGVFRNNIPTKFIVDATAIAKVVDDIDEILQFALKEELHIALQDVQNYQQVKEAIINKLSLLSNRKIINEEPLIYHLDVAAMYPNIMLTNRLQPPSIVDEATCAVCDFNKPGKTCQRKMTWSWRGEYFVAKKNELKMIKNQLESESFASTEVSRFAGKNRQQAAYVTPEPALLPFEHLSIAEQQTKLKQRLTQYCKKIYKKIHETKVEQRESIVCMKENSFYVDTVRKFRDRRYDFKALLKDAKKNLDSALEARDTHRIYEAKKTLVLYDSLQLAHKCILNSFYGYVMRKGSRWYSMEMAGIVCYTGAEIIRRAREAVEKLGGRPLELDTDGIWCMFPKSFPDTIELQIKSAGADRRSQSVSFPCILLNRLVHSLFTNHQYETLVDPLYRKYVKSSENSIFFEIDGPYRAMILPASVDEDRLLKKRYAVYNEDGSLAELKGFEVKRRGELKLTKVFQTQLFDAFLHGETLKETYESAAAVANQWLDMLLSKGAGMQEYELFDLLSEKKNMSKSLEDYGEQKSTAISTAKRLAEFLGDQVLNGEGGSSLSCSFVISERPHGLPVAQRAIPTAIFAAEPAVKSHYLKLWLRDTDNSSNGVVAYELADILDWGYYMERFVSLVQKLIVIPAAFQSIENPVPRVPYPEWLRKRTLVDPHTQLKLAAYDSKNGDESHVNALLQIVPLSERVDFRSESQKHRDEAFKSKKEELETKEKELLDKVGKISLQDVPYNEWLRVYKLKWKKDRAARRSTKSGMSLLKHWKRNVSGVGENSKKMMAFTMKSIWQIVQVKHISSSDLSLWVLQCSSLSGKNNDFAESSSNIWTLKKIWVSVPKVIYINSRLDYKELKRDFPFKKNTIDSPIWLDIYRGSCAPGYIYETETTEKVYYENFSEIWRPISHGEVPEISSLYETDVSPLFTALLKLGNCVNSVASVGASMTDFKSLHSRPDVSSEYLKGNVLQYVFMSIIRQNKRLMSVVAVPCLNILSVVVEASELPTLTEASIRYLFVTGDQSAKASLWSFDENIKIFVDSVKPSRTKPFGDNLWRAVRKFMIHNVENIHDKPPFVVLLSINDDLVVPWLSQLEELYPVLLLPEICESNNSSVEDMLGSSWYRQTLESSALTLRALASRSLADFIDLARFSQLPLCNIATVYNSAAQTGLCRNFIQFEEGKNSLALDILCARLFKSSRYLLPPFQPSPFEFSYLLFHSLSVSKDPAPISLHSLSSASSVEVVEDGDAMICSYSSAWKNQPGFFGTVCFDLSLSGLFLNALLLSSSNLNIGLASTNEPLLSNSGDPALPSNLLEFLAYLEHCAKGLNHESAMISKVWRLLQSLAAHLCKIIATHHSTQADMLVSYFERWLTTNSNLFFHPAIVNYAQSAVSKCVNSLLQECASLAVRVIHIDHSRLILATKKSNRVNARAFLDYFIKKIGQSDSNLAWLSLSIQQIWKNVLWLDSKNFHVADMKIAADDDSVALEDGDSDDAESHLFSHKSKISAAFYNWKLIQAKLPHSLHAAAYSVISEFVDIISKTQSNLLARKKKQLRLVGISPSSQGLFSSQSHLMSDSMLMSDEHLLDDVASEGENADYISEDEIPMDSILKESSPSNKKRFKEGPQLKEEQQHLTLPSEFTMRLFKLLKEIIGYYLSKDPTSTVPLEFIKILIAIFSLEPRYKKHTRSLRKQFLQLIDVTEFSDQARFVPLRPLLVALIPACPSCLACNLTIEIYGEKVLTDLACSSCQAELPGSLLVEHIVLTMKRRLFQSVVNQDAVCRKCGLPKELEMLKFCPQCKGETYVSKESALAIKQELQGLVDHVNWLPLKDYYNSLYFTK